MKDFLNTNVSYALVVRGDIDSIKELKKHLADLSDLELIYQRMSLNKLYIMESLPSGSKEGENVSE